MAGESPEVEADLSPEFAERRALWAAERAPMDREGQWAFDRAVAASLRIERCEQAVDGLIAVARKRAELSWDEDRLAEAAALFGRLARDPIRVTTQLRTTLAGAELVLDAWMTLASALESGRDWLEDEASIALDLLGVNPRLRSARTGIDPIAGADPIAFRLALAKAEIEGLEVLCERALIPLEEADQRRALAGDLALLSKPVARILRYERAAWRRYREATKTLDTAQPSASPIIRPKSPVLAPPQEPPKLPKSPPKPTPQEERRALMAEMKPLRDAVVAELVAQGFEDEEAWIEELERRSGSPGSRPGGFIPVAAGRPAAERTQLATVAAD